MLARPARHGVDLAIEKLVLHVAPRFVFEVRLIRVVVNLAGATGTHSLRLQRAHAGGEPWALA